MIGKVRFAALRSCRGSAGLSNSLKRVEIFIGLSFQSLQVFRSMSFDPEQPITIFLCFLQPGELETRRVFKQCVPANKALAELKGAW